MLINYSNKIITTKNKKKQLNNNPFQKANLINNPTFSCYKFKHKH